MTAYLGALAQSVAARTGTSPWFARKAIAATAEEIAARLRAGERVTLRGLGVFYLKRVGAKSFRLPGARRLARVRAHRYPAWRPSESLARDIRARRYGSG